MITFDCTGKREIVAGCTVVIAQGLGKLCSRTVASVDGSWLALEGEAYSWPATRVAIIEGGLLHGHARYKNGCRCKVCVSARHEWIQRHKTCSRCGNELRKGAAQCGFCEEETREAA